MAWPNEFVDVLDRKAQPRLAIAFEEHVRLSPALELLSESAVHPVPDVRAVPEAILYERNVSTGKQIEIALPLCGDRGHLR